MPRRNDLSPTPLRILYAAGPGDVIRTYQHWSAGRHDPNETALTYSAQFYDVCRELGAHATVISTHERRDRLDDGPFRILHRPISTPRNRFAFHLVRLAQSARLMLTAIRCRADILLIAAGSHFFILAPLRLLGVRIIPSMHCAFWPAGQRPTGLAQRVIQFLDGWFWRHIASATIAVSPECERQVREVAGHLRGPIHQVRAQYRRAYFDSVPSPPPHSQRPFRILYAGRIERSKGVFDLLESAAILQREHPGQFTFELCGDGSASAALAEAVRSKDLSSSFILRGRLDQSAMADAYARAHVVVVPTRSAAGFAEGLNKVAVEAALAGRPLVTSRLSNALDVLGQAILEVPPDDPAAYASAFVLLADDEPLYQSKRLASRAIREQFFDTSQGFGHALRTLFTQIQHRLSPASPPTPIVALPATPPKNQPTRRAA